MLHRFEYTYSLPEWGAISLDLDEDMDVSEKESIAIAEIEDLYDEAENIEITKITVEN